MMQLVRAIQKYDPSYTDKVRVVAEKIEDAFQKQFTILELNDCLDFDGNRYIRMFCRRGFLEAVKGGKGVHTVGRCTAVKLAVHIAVQQSVLLAVFGPGRFLLQWLRDCARVLSTGLVPM